jgi:hypothetical protein
MGGYVRFGAVVELLKKARYLVDSRGRCVYFSAQGVDKPRERSVNTQRDRCNTQGLPVSQAHQFNRKLFWPLVDIS